jgi:hypothetical protein
MSGATPQRLGERDEIAHAIGAKRPWQFGSGQPDRDPRLNGAKGGSTPRRSKTAQLAKQRVLASKNGQANLGIYKLEVAREEQRERTVYRLEKELSELDLALYDTREALDEARDELRALDERIAEREAALEQAALSDEVLTHLLRTVGAERLERLLPELGLTWFEDSDDVAAASS